MSTHQNCFNEGSNKNTHNLCFEQKQEKNHNLSSYNCHFHSEHYCIYIHDNIMEFPSFPSVFCVCFFQEKVIGALVP